MNKEFEAHYSTAYAWIFFGLAMAFLVAIGVLVTLSISMTWSVGLFFCILVAVVAMVFLCVFAWAIRKKGVAVEIADGKLILHKKKTVIIPLSEIYRISIHDGNGSFDLTVKTVSKNYSIHCFIKEEQKKKREFIRLFKNRKIAVGTYDLNGPD